MSRLIAQPIAPSALDGAEELLENLVIPDEALANLAEKCGRREEEFRQGDVWATIVTLDDTSVCLRGNDALYIGQAPAGGFLRLDFRRDRDVEDFVVKKIGISNQAAR